VYPNIIYADKALNYKSGYIIDDNVIWALYSMYDKFAKPNIDGLKEKYPDSKIVGLYHGDIAGSVTDTGRISENGIDTNVFKECDFVLAGHIHKFQEIKKNGVPIVYAGSIFQQDSGENTTGHGFLIWDVEKCKYKLHEVTNKYKIYKFKIKTYDDVKEDTEKLLNL
jgi:DNA repair exonuclease SbcCD nuclease subunit